LMFVFLRDRGKRVSRRELAKKGERRVRRGESQRRKGGKGDGRVEVERSEGERGDSGTNFSSSPTVLKIV